MLIFSPNSGRVQVIRLQPSSVPAAIRFPDLGYESMQAIITSCQFRFVPGFQLSDTIGDDALLLTFDENIGPASISGIIFDNVCDPVQPVGSPFNRTTGRSGVNEVINWWKRRNLTRSRQPAELTIGASHPIRVFIAEMDLAIESVKDLTWNFRISLLRVPERDTVEDDEFAILDDPDAVANVIQPPGRSVLSPPPATAQSGLPAFLPPSSDSEYQPRPLLGALTGR